MPMGKGTYGKRVGRPATNPSRKKKAVMAKSSGRLEKDPASDPAYISAQKALDAAENKDKESAMKAAKQSSEGDRKDGSKKKTTGSVSKNPLTKQTTTRKMVATKKKPTSAPRRAPARRTTRRV